MAEHFIGEFFDIFRELGVEAEHYRMRDHYRAGRLNESIDKILGNAAAVRRVYKEVSGSVKSEHWHPFQAICEVCGRIRHDRGRGLRRQRGGVPLPPQPGEVGQGLRPPRQGLSFDGKGKLPWKLEWVAKWRIFGVTIEGAGKDHNTKGGSRDVAAGCLQAIFGEKPPLNIPYEFFLAEGKKMSSSKGIGSAARDMADFLAPEVLRYLILRPAPKSPVDFPSCPITPTSRRGFIWPKSSSSSSSTISTASTSASTPTPRSTRKRRSSIASARSRALKTRSTPTSSWCSPSCRCRT